jgi:hypothetical protein
MLRGKLMMGLCLPWFVACGSAGGSGEKKSNQAPSAKPPVVVVPSRDSDVEPTRAPSSPAPRPGAVTNPPAATPSGSGPETSIPYIPPVPGSPEAIFTQSIEGRRRAYCERDFEKGTSRFYAVEFLNDRWSTMLFEYPDNPACIDIAGPNDGQPRTYRYNVKAAEDGWFRVSGACLSPDNGCIGEAEVWVKIMEDQSVQVKKVRDDNLWFRPGLMEDNYFW